MPKRHDDNYDAFTYCPDCTEKKACSPEHAAFMEVAAMIQEMAHEIESNVSDSGKQARVDRALAAQEDETKKTKWWKR